MSIETWRGDRSELEAQDELIALPKEKVSVLREGSKITPARNLAWPTLVWGVGLRPP